MFFFDHEVGVEAAVQASSFVEWLERYATTLENGQWRVNDEGWLEAVE